MGYDWILQHKSGENTSLYGCTLDATGYVFNGPIYLGIGGPGFPYGIDVYTDEVEQPWPS